MISKWKREQLTNLHQKFIMSFEFINPTGCKKCGGKRWEYTDYDHHQQEQIVEYRCCEPECGYQELTYGDEFHSYYKTPEEVQEFIEEHELEEELEEVEEEYLQGLSNVASGNFRSLSSEEKDKFCKRMLRLSVLLSANKEAV